MRLKSHGRRYWCPKGCGKKVLYNGINWKIKPKRAEYVCPMCQTTYTSDDIIKKKSSPVSLVDNIKKIQSKYRDESE